MVKGSINADDDASQSVTSRDSSLKGDHIELRILRALKEDKDKHDNSPCLRPRANHCKKVGFVICTALIIVLLTLWMTGKKDGVLPFIIKDDKDYNVTVDAVNNRITLHPKAGYDHKYTLIFLHGPGDFDRLLTRFLHQRDARMTPLYCKVILPKAPLRFKKRSWYHVSRAFGKLATLEEK